MARPHSPNRARGFSMVEMLVALVFTMLLMAGMASVFKASLSTFYTSGEALSSSRRNLMSINLLGDDLNTACMFLADISDIPPTYATNPPFFIVPNAPVTGAVGTPGANDPTTSDELYFALDQPLPFEGTLPPGAVTQRSAAEMIADGTAATAADMTFTIDCGNAAYTTQVQKGQSIFFKDSATLGYITDTPVPNGSTVTIINGPDPNAGLYGNGATEPSKVKHNASSRVVFIQRNQQVRYRLQMLQLDPTNPVGTPCLVRDQGSYSANAFAPDANIPQQIVAENVQSFKVYLSANSGQSWAGLSTAPGGDGWDSGANGIRPQLDTQLASAGRPGYTSTRGSELWFRFIPVLVRVDIVTRSATQRTEYATTANTSAYRLLTQSQVFVPRHSGLPISDDAPSN